MLEIHQGAFTGVPVGYSFSWKTNEVSIVAVLHRPGFNPKATMFFRICKSPPWATLRDEAQWKKVVGVVMAGETCLYGEGPADSTPPWNWPADGDIPNVEPDALTCHDNGWYFVEKYPIGANTFDTIGYLEARRNNSAGTILANGSVVKEGWLIKPTDDVTTPEFWDRYNVRVTPGKLRNLLPFVQLQNERVGMQVNWLPSRSQITYSDKAPT